MEKSADVTPRKTSKLEVYLKETGLSQQEIAQKDGVSQESVPRVEQKLVSGLSLVGQWNGRCGRKRKSAARDDRQLVHFCKKKGKWQAKCCTKKWNPVVSWVLQELFVADWSTTDLDPDNHAKCQGWHLPWSKSATNGPEVIFACQKITGAKFVSVMNQTFTWLMTERHMSTGSQEKHFIQTVSWACQTSDVSHSVVNYLCPCSWSTPYSWKYQYKRMLKPRLLPQLRSWGQIHRHVLRFVVGFVLRYVLRQKLRCRKMILWHVLSQFTNFVVHSRKNLS